MLQVMAQPLDWRGDEHQGLLINSWSGGETTKMSGKWKCIPKQLVFVLIALIQTVPYGMPLARTVTIDEEMDQRNHFASHRNIGDRVASTKKLGIIHRKYLTLKESEEAK
jgi:hypothetical protein